MRTGQAAHHRAVRRRLALHLLRQEPAAKGGIAAQRKPAGGDEDCLLYRFPGTPYLIPVLMILIHTNRRLWYREGRIPMGEPEGWENLPVDFPKGRTFLLDAGAYYETEFEQETPATIVDLFLYLESLRQRHLELANLLDDLRKEEIPDRVESLAIYAHKVFQAMVVMVDDPSYENRPVKWIYVSLQPFWCVILKRHFRKFETFENLLTIFPTVTDVASQVMETFKTAYLDEGQMQERVHGCLEVARRYISAGADEQLLDLGTQLLQLPLSRLPQGVAMLDFMDSQPVRHRTEQTALAYLESILGFLNLDCPWERCSRIATCARTYICG